MNLRNVVQRLETDGTVTFTARGNSMTPRIRSGEEVTVVADAGPFRKGDVVLAKVGRYYYLHLVSAVRDGRYQISNNHGHVNGWATRIHGRMVR